MTSPNTPQDAFLSGSSFGQLYARLDAARTLVQAATDSHRPLLESKHKDELYEINRRINGFIGLLLNLSKQEAHRFAETHDKES